MSELVAIRRPSRGLPKAPTPHLRDFGRAELESFVAQTLGGPAYRATQIFEWLHRRRVTQTDAMTNLPAADRTRLAELARVEPLRVDAVARAADGTRKLRLLTADDAAIEAVLIPNDARGYTLCVSSMVGCSLTCQFCATQSLGFVRNLATWEIVDQVYRAQDLLTQEQSPRRLTNLVLMGMGEPLHNYVQVERALSVLTDDKGANIAGRRITVSTAGLVPAIERFGREGLASEVGLAVSLNATTDEVRDKIMPINTRWNIATLLAAIRSLPTPKRRRVTIEYVLLAGVNDTEADADRLAKLIGKLGVQVNAIPFNPHPHAPFARPSDAAIAAFVARLRTHGLPVHVRTPRGDDIDAACGQLALAKND